MSASAFSIESSHPVRVDATDEEPIALLNKGDTLYYKQDSSVSSSSNDGSLTSGQSATFTIPTWIRSASSSYVQSVPVHQSSFDTLILRPTASQNVIYPAAGSASLWVKNSQVVSHPDNTFTIPAGTKIGGWDADGNLWGGPNDLLRDIPNSVLNKSVPDFFFNQHVKRLYTRSLILGECGDPVDLGIQRAGPNNQYPIPSGGVDAMTGITTDQSLGTIWWRGFTTPAAGTPGVTTGGSFQTQSGSIAVKAAENIFDQSSGGYMVFATTPVGTGTPVERAYLWDDGRISIGSGTKRGMLFVQNTVASASVLTLFAHASQSADILVVNNGAGTQTFKMDSTGQLRLGESINLQLGTTTGTQVGTGSGQKLGFWGATPVVQQVLATGTGKTVDNVITALQGLGLFKQS